VPVVAAVDAADALAMETAEVGGTVAVAGTGVGVVVGGLVGGATNGVWDGVSVGGRIVCKALGSEVGATVAEINPVGTRAI